MYGLQHRQLESELNKKLTAMTAQHVCTAVYSAAPQRENILPDKKGPQAAMTDTEAQHLMPKQNLNSRYASANHVKVFGELSWALSGFMRADVQNKNAFV